MSFAESIKMEPDYIGANGRTDAEIAEAEKELEIKFAKDYHEYLKKIGIACFDGHELTGLTNTDRLNVVSVTKELRKQSEEICALSIFTSIVLSFACINCNLWYACDAIT